MSPTQRTLKWLRDAGYLCEVVERWNPHAKIRQDLFGAIDIVASSPECPILGVQCTSDSNFAARLKKLRDSDKVQQLVKNGWDIFVVGWKKGSKEPRVYSFGHE